jgi:predicted nucleic acid-binding Zn ribbon protein
MTCHCGAPFGHRGRHRLHADRNAAKRAWYDRMVANRKCPRCGSPHSRDTVLCEGCTILKSDRRRVVLQARRRDQRKVA